MQMLRVTRAAIAVLLSLAAISGSGIGYAQDISSADVPFDESAPKIAAGPVPSRVLHCELRRAMNIDPARQQREEDIVYQGHFPLTLTLPGTSVPNVAGVGTARPDVKPHAGYRVTSDPNKLFEQFPSGAMDRVADYWPAQVQIGETVMGKAFQFIILNAVPGEPGTMSIYVSRAADAVAIDLGWIFRGTCRA